MIRRFAIGVVVGALALTAAGTFGSVRSLGNSRTAGRPDAGPIEPAHAGAGVSQQIAALQRRVSAVPADGSAWASLGLAFVQKARITADPRLYDAAGDALRRSMRVQPDDNFAAAAGRAALAAARHDFTGARKWAERGLAINPHSPLLYGTLADALVQLGRYEDAYRATQRMVDVRPDTASLARVSYTWELRGDVDAARTYMQRALDDAPNGADRAFARYYLAELAFDNGDPAGAKMQADRGLRDDPEYVALFEARAKAEAAAGDTDAALADYRRVVDRLPQPGYVLQFGELLESLGRADEARTEYQVFEAEQKLFSANGVAADVDAIRYEADHGSPTRAIQLAAGAVQRRPFYEMQDAYAWALHVNGRDGEALAWSNKARALGTRNATVFFHAGIIEQALGDKTAAIRDLRRALQINPHFNPLHSRTAARALASLGAS